MFSNRGLARVLAGASLLLVDAKTARSEPADVVRGAAIGPGLLRSLGHEPATKLLAPSTGRIGALVALPKGARAEDLGLEPVTAGIGRLRARAERIEAFAAAHPELRIEMAPTVHPLLDAVRPSVLVDKAHAVRGVDGHGVMIGVADTGLDVTHPEMLDASGKSRVAWILDLSLDPCGYHADLEQKFGLKDDVTGKIVAGCVLAKEDIDELLSKIADKTCVETPTKLCAPSDEIGHGTHVTGIAAATGNGSKYAGMAPSADVVFVRVTRNASEGIENDDLVRAVQFMFDRATAAARPMVVNLSLGSDFGPHDGTFLWERAIGEQVGPNFPGRVIVAAAGNSGSIVDSPIHQSVEVTHDARSRVAIRTLGAEDGGVQVWVTFRRGANLKVGLEGPNGEWIAPVSSGHQAGRTTGNYNAAVIYGSNLPDSQIPQGSNGAVVIWQGKWPAGDYMVTFEGSGMAELYLQSVGDAALGGDRPVVFVNGVREGTINLPATYPSIIGVGCTVNRDHWRSISGAEVALVAPTLDREGGLPFGQAMTPQAGGSPTRELVPGEVCWFSSAGPTATGVPKPDIAAPGALVASAMSRNAKPGSANSVFNFPCPPLKNGSNDRRCLQVDETHAIASGTSMSSPVVAGVVALLLHADPTLTQDKVLALLQAGAHRFRGEAPFEDQSGPGEVDALASLDALAQMQNPALYLPAYDQSWVTTSADYVAADGSTPLTAIIELRTTGGAHRGDLFDAPRLQPVVLVDGQPIDDPPAIVRRGPGVWFYAWTPPAGLGGRVATFGATFDGQPIVKYRTLPIATDRWNAVYPSKASGSGCSIVAPASPAGEGGSHLPFWALAAAALGWRRRRQRSSAIVTSQPCGSQTSSSGSNP